VDVVCFSHTQILTLREHVIHVETDRSDPDSHQFRVDYDRRGGGVVLSDVVGERITVWRRRRGWNRERLAEECQALGMADLTPAVLTNIESGRRQQGSRRRLVTVDELAVISTALSVPLVLFLVPYPEKKSVSLLPGRSVDTESALDWLTNMSFLSMHRTGLERQELGERIEFWTAATKPVHLIAAHNDELAQLRVLNQQLTDQQRLVTDAERRLRRATDQLALLPPADEASAEEAEEIQALADEVAEHETRFFAESTRVRLLLGESNDAERRLVTIRDGIRGVEHMELPRLPEALEHLAARTAGDYERRTSRALFGSPWD
jgi:transcriptional regulator with XRE-family HTH domain